MAAGLFTLFTPAYEILPPLTSSRCYHAWPFLSVNQIRISTELLDNANKNNVPLSCHCSTSVEKATTVSWCWNCVFLYYATFITTFAMYFLFCL